MRLLNNAVVYLNTWFLVNAPYVLVISVLLLAGLLFIKPSVVGGMPSYLVLLSLGACFYFIGVIFLLKQKKTDKKISAKNETINLQVARTKLGRAELEREIVKLRAIKAAIVAEKVEIDAQRQHLMIDQRRFKAFERIRVLERIKFGKGMQELRTIHGKNIPKEKSDEVVDNFLGGLMKEDGAFVRSMFSNPAALTSEPKPIKTSENNVHNLLAQKVKEKAIKEEELEEIICPIISQVMQDPVKGEDGRTYDRCCLENIYYALPGTYPFDRREMKIEPCDLPRDQAMYDKIQALVKQCEQETHLVKAQEDNDASSERSVSGICNMAS